VRRDNKSGFKGVHYIERDKTYCAEIQVDGEQIRLGYFHSPEPASAAYEAAAKHYFGEFARTA
jgi:hypothetical protein